MIPIQRSMQSMDIDSNNRNGNVLDLDRPMSITMDIRNRSRLSTELTELKRECQEMMQRQHGLIERIKQIERRVFGVPDHENNNIATMPKPYRVTTHSQMIEGQARFGTTQSSVYSAPSASSRASSLYESSNYGMSPEPGGHEKERLGLNGHQQRHPTTLPPQFPPLLGQAPPTPPPLPPPKQRNQYLHRKPLPPVPNASAKTMPPQSHFKSSEQTRPKTFGNDQPIHVVPSSSSASLSSYATGIQQQLCHAGQEERNNSQPLTANANSNTLDETLGPCAACFKEVRSVKGACKAMDAIYHADCFVCSMCKSILLGKEFYHVSGKVYCEEDYQNHVVNQMRCFKCKEPLRDTMVEALDKFYHPSCFRCCVCDVCLENVKFTIDREHRIYCVNDYHRSFAPICGRCKKPITPLDEDNETTVRVVSMGQNYHVDCYSCEQCNVQLTDDESTRCYPIDDHLFCKQCSMSKRNENALKV